MATKSANLYARIEPDVKEQAEGILAALGIPAPCDAPFARPYPTDFTSMGYVLFHAGISAVLCFRRIATGIGYTS